MRVRVDACLRIDRAEVAPRLLERLRLALSLPNPAYLNRVRLGLPVWSEPETLSFVEEDGGEMRLPRGAIDVLRRAARAEGVEVACADERVLPAESLDGLRTPALRDYQADAVARFARATQGTVVIPCGGGKTRVGLGAIASLRTPALVLVHTLDLAEQWMREIAGVLGQAVGLIGDGTYEPAPITVAVIQALARRDATALDRLLGAFGLVILDEAHHVAASMFRDVVGRCPARYRLGLTATPERQDGLTPLLEWYFGPPLLAVSHETLVEAGVLRLPEVRVVETAFTFPYTGAHDYAPMLQALVGDEPRNALIAETVAAEARAGHTCLVLSGRIDHCEALKAGIDALGASAVLLTGGVAKARRAEILAAARTGDTRVLVATSLADEGLDLPRLSRVFLAYPGRARGRTLQRLGRLMRLHPEKTDAVLFDFVDRRVPILRRHHLDRKRLYADVLGVPASALASRSASVPRGIWA